MHNTTEKKLTYFIFTLILFYVIISAICILDIVLLIKQYIEEKENAIFNLIFLILFPVSLLIQAFLVFYEFECDSDYNYQTINNKIEIVNAQNIFELDFRYINDDDINRGIILIFASSFLSYTKLIIFHLCINSYKNNTKYGFFSSLKYVLLKIALIQYILQTFPCFVVNIISQIKGKMESEKKIDIIELFSKLYNICFILYTLMLILYIFLYIFYFSRFERNLLYQAPFHETNENFDNEINSVCTMNLKHSADDDYNSKKNFTFTYNTNSARKKLNANDSVDIKNSL